MEVEFWIVCECEGSRFLDWFVSLRWIWIFGLVSKFKMG